MNAHYTRSSGMTRLVSAFMASVITATLFGAVAIGLTGEDVSMLLAQSHDVTVQASVHRARAPDDARWRWQTQGISQSTIGD
jgi:hypothetical protein